MSRHTPGPWEVERRPIQSRGGSNTVWRIGPFHACIYDDWRPREAGISEAENEANARLIAASPDLADALHAAMRMLTFACGVPDDHEVVEQARAALAKAGRLP